MAAPTGQTHDCIPTAIVITPNQHLTRGRRPHMTQCRPRLFAVFTAQHFHPSRLHHDCRPNERSDFLSVEKQYPLQRYCLLVVDRPKASPSTAGFIFDERVE